MIPAYLSVVVILSGISFVAYGFDKRWAINSRRRLPERTLHLLALFGGWPGALLGQRYFRHKTKKLSFRVVLWLMVVLHLAVVGAAAYLLWG